MSGRLTERGAGYGRMSAGYGRGGAGSAPISSFPTSGLIALWDASQAYAFTVRNILAIANPGDANISVIPRRHFNAGGNSFNATITENNQIAPDGSTEASTVVATDGGWYVQQVAHGLTPGNTYTFCLTVKDLSGGSTPDFVLKDGDGNSTGTLTATSSWGRYSLTHTVSNADKAFLFTAPDGEQLGNFAICDFQLYAGSSDLNPSPLSAKPPAIVNGDITLSAPASDGRITAGTTGLVQLDSAITLDEYTLAWVAIHDGTSNDPNLEWEPVFSRYSDATQFTVQNSQQIIPFGGGGPGPANGSPQNSISVKLWANTNGGNFICVLRVSLGAGTSDAFLNNIRFLGSNASFTPRTDSEWLINLMAVFNLISGLSFYRLALWNRSISDEEVTTVVNWADEEVGLDLTPLVLFVGTSITEGVQGTSYAYKCAPFLDPKMYGCNWGQASSTLAEWNSYAAAVDELLTRRLPGQQMILYSEIGTNDMPNYQGDPSGCAAAIATWLDARRNAGWDKIVINTLMDRGDVDLDHFHADRLVFNTIVRGWIGTHIDAVADWAADPTMGADGAYSDDTYFASDLVHPVNAGYDILAPITANALNSIGDITAPVLSLPVGTETGSTTADLGVTSDEGRGTIWWVVTTGSATPTAVQVQAGKDSSNAAATAAGFEYISAAGAKTMTNGATGLTTATTYYAHYVQVDPAGNTSNVVTSSSFTTS